MKVDKQTLQRELRLVLERERDKSVAAHKTTSEGVTHADARSEGSKDMRATEASYIARGQAQRAAALIEDVGRVISMPLRDFGPDDPVGLSALVTVADEHGSERTIFVAPAGGGVRLQGGIEVTTPRAPLGRALLGARQGDLLELERAGALSELEVIAVR